MELAHLDQIRGKMIYPGLLCLAFAAISAAQTIPLYVNRLKPRNVKLEAVTFKGRDAIRATDIATADVSDGARLAMIALADFQDGVIELDLTGDTLPGRGPEFRGFTGIAFHVSSDGTRYECFYLRPKNGRSQDQLQRNHSAQYISNPEFPWQRLREESPGKYETYVDLVPGEWTKMRLEVRGGSARLYVNGAEQPALIVDPLKHEPSRGGIALWVGPGTVAHFANLRLGH